MNPNATHMSMFLKRIDDFLQSTLTLNTQPDNRKRHAVKYIGTQASSSELLIVNPHSGSDELIEMLWMLHSETHFCDYAIELKYKNLFPINRLIACMMSEFIYTQQNTHVGSIRHDINHSMPDVTSTELRLLMDVAFRKPTYVTKSTLVRLGYIADKYSFVKPVCNALQATMNEYTISDVNHVSNDEGMLDDDTEMMDGDTMMTDNTPGTKEPDNDQVLIKQHNESSALIEKLASLHSEKTLSNYQIKLADKATLDTNKLVAYAMSGIIQQKSQTSIGNATENTFNMEDVTLFELTLLMNLVFQKRQYMPEYTLGRLICIADEYEFSESVRTLLWQTMYPYEAVIGKLKIRSLPKGFNPQKAITLNIEGTPLNVRQIVPLLLNSIPVTIRTREIALDSLQWDAHLFVEGYTHSMEYVEVAQMLGGFAPCAAHSGYVPRGTAIRSISRETVPHVAYDLIEYGKYLALNGMCADPASYFNPVPEYRISARGYSMNARRLVPFIINSMYASFVANEKLSQPRKYPNPQNIRYYDGDSRWTLDEQWIQEITAPDIQLYFEVAKLAFGMESPRMPASSKELYNQTLTGTKTGFYSPIEDLVSFGKWLAHNERSQFVL